jgi:hypothetical protein
MEKRHLLRSFVFLLFSEEPHPAFGMPSVYALDESATFENSLVIPLNFEHPPVLLDVNRSGPFFFSVLLSLSIKLS